MRRHRSGVSLVELIFTLSVLGVLAGVAVPAAAGLRDVLAVRGARDAVAGGLAHARAAAITHGGASLEIDLDAGVARVVSAAGDTLGGAIRLTAGHGVEIEVPARTGVVAVRFDGLGIGRLANRTVVFRRGRAEARLVVTAYGRWRDG